MAVLGSNSKPIMIKGAKKGKTLIWPTDFTHTHRGVISLSKEKYIITGWLSFIE